MAVCEQVFWCIQPNQWASVSRRLWAIEQVALVWREKISVVWLLDGEGEVAPVADKLQQLALEDFKITFAEPKPLQSMNMNSIGVQPADIVIEPDVTAFDLTAFAKTDELAVIGEQATLEALPKIMKQLGELDCELYPGKSLS